MTFVLEALRGLKSALGNIMREEHDGFLVFGMAFGSVFSKMILKIKFPLHIASME